MISKIKKTKTTVLDTELPSHPQASLLWLHDQEYLESYPILCGVDEVGRGPLAGNVVAACAILDLKGLEIIGLNDSKKIKESKREELFIEIQNRAIGFGIGECSPQEIDTHNILRATWIAMQRALTQLKLKPDLVLVDGNQRIPELKWTQKTIIKGDGVSASIAAASVLAKVTRDRQLVELDKQYPEYGFAKHKGYPTKDHYTAIAKYGLTTWHRRSFCTKDAKQQVELWG